MYMGLKYKVAESQLIKKNVFQILESTPKTGRDKRIDLRVAACGSSKHVNSKLICLFKAVYKFWTSNIC